MLTRSLFRSLHVLEQSTLKNFLFSCKIHRVKTFTGNVICTKSTLIKDNVKDIKDIHGDNPFVFD